jgi:nicotinate-nucleotide adenylyltransferase
MKTGLFFGSFNPVHVGHMVIANYMLEFTPLESIWFVVSPQNPLKNKASLLPQHHRLAIVNRAIGDNPGMKASDIEFRLPQPSYTIHTLVHLKEKYPDRHFVLLLGSDNLESFHKWKNYEQILEDYELYVYPRKESKGGELSTHPRVTWVNAPFIEISSTFIRKSIRERKDIRYFIPEQAYTYIREMHFYEK